MREREREGGRSNQQPIKDAVKFGLRCRSSSSCHETRGSRRLAEEERTALLASLPRTYRPAGNTLLPCVVSLYDTAASSSPHRYAHTLRYCLPLCVTGWVREAIPSPPTTLSPGFQRSQGDSRLMHPTFVLVEEIP